MHPQIGDYIIVPNYIANGVQQVVDRHHPTEQLVIHNVDHPPLRSYDLAISPFDVTQILPQPPAYKKPVYSSG